MGTVPDPAPRPWRIWIDTGGTFTDCIGIDPAGSIHRVKVLSSSALRGTILGLNGKVLRIQERWNAPADFVRGFRFRLLSDSIAGPGAVPEDEATCFTVVSYDPQQCHLELNRELAGSPVSGNAFEVLSQEEAPILATRLATGIAAGERLPRVEMRLATTRGTNALLEGRIARTALFVTRGFADLIAIGDQQRTDLFAINIRKRLPLYETVVEVEERLAADGSVLVPLNLDNLYQPAENPLKNGMESRARGLLDEGIECAAIALLHSYRNPVHELSLSQWLRTLGFRWVSCSSDLSPTIKILPRAETAVVDAALSPAIYAYLSRVQERLGGGRLLVMTSAGGLVKAESIRAKDCLLSGPAGGVVGAVRAAKSSGHERIIAFDMGGTSTDVARYDGAHDYVFEHWVGEARVAAPALAIDTVAAGGGSICYFDGHALHVGPKSAGAHPGPACYGAGGPLTLTDVHLLLGRLDPGRFEIPISFNDAERAAEELHSRVANLAGQSISREALLEGLLKIANERMADAIRSVSLRQGYDPMTYVLLPFGGAGGLHACAVADNLGIHLILAPPEAGLLSAMGLGCAPVERFVVRQILQPLVAVSDDLPRWLSEMEIQATEAVAGEGIDPGNVVIRHRLVYLRVLGQESSIPIKYQSNMALEDAFEDRYARLFGYTPSGKLLEVESLRIAASSIPDYAVFSYAPELRDAGTSIIKKAWFNGEWLEAEHYERAQISPGAVIKGPAIIYDAYNSLAVEPGWSAERDDVGALILRR